MSTVDLPDINVDGGSIRLDTSTVLGLMVGAALAGLIGLRFGFPKP